MEKDTFFKKILSFVSIVAFIADLITISIFIKDLFVGGLNKGGLSQVIIIVLIFAFGFFLLLYSKSEFVKNIDQIVNAFGWIYVVFGAFILAIFSWYFFNYFQYSFGAFIGYTFIILLITALGVLLVGNVSYSLKTLTIPFLIVALEQIVLMVLRILSPVGFFDRAIFFIGCVFLFLLSASLIFGMLILESRLKGN